MKTAVSIPDRVFKSAEKLARRLGLSRSELYARALADWIERRDEAHITEQINEFLARHPVELDPFVRAAQAKALPKEDW